MTFERANGPARPVTLSLRGRALRLLAQREHSRAELAGKLRPHCETPDELDALLTDLEAKGWLDDKRASDSLVHRKSGRFGAARIRQDLQTKGLSPELIASALEGLQASESERALSVWQKKFGTPAQTLAERAKQMRFLLARGFSASVVSRVTSGRAAEEALATRSERFGEVFFTEEGDDSAAAHHPAED